MNFETDCLENKECIVVQFVEIYFTQSNLQQSRTPESGVKPPQMDKAFKIRSWGLIWPLRDYWPCFHHNHDRTCFKFHPSFPFLSVQHFHFFSSYSFDKPYLISRFRPHKKMLENFRHGALWLILFNYATYTTGQDNNVTLNNLPSCAKTCAESAALYILCDTLVFQPF